MCKNAFYFTHRRCFDVCPQVVRTINCQTEECTSSMCTNAFYFTHRRCFDVGVCTSTLFCRTSVCVFDKNTSSGVGCENVHTTQCSGIRQTFWHPTYTCTATSRVRRCIGCENIHLTPCSRIQQTFWHPTYTWAAFCVFDKDISCVSNRRQFDVGICPKQFDFGIWLCPRRC